MKRLSLLVAILVISNITFAQKKVSTETNQKKEEKNTVTDSSAVKKNQEAQTVHITPGSSGVNRSIGYKFNSNNENADPGIGIFRFNTDTVTKITSIIVNNVDISGEDQTKWYSTWDKETGATGRGRITIADIDGKIIAVFYFTGVFIDENGFWTLPVEYVSGGLPLDGSVYYYVFDRIAKKEESGNEEKEKKETPPVLAAVVTPVTQIKDTVQNVPVVPVVEATKIVPAVQVKDTVPNVPVVPVIEAVKVVPAVQLKDTVQNVPVVPVVEAAKVVPAVQVKDTVPNVPVVQITKTEEAVPVTQTVSAKVEEAVTVVPPAKNEEAEPVFSTSKVVASVSVSQVVKVEEAVSIKQPERKEAEPEPAKVKSDTQSTQPSPAKQSEPKATSTIDNSAPKVQSSRPVTKTPPAQKTTTTTINQGLPVNKSTSVPAKQPQPKTTTAPVNQGAPVVKSAPPVPEKQPEQRPQINQLPRTRQESPAYVPGVRTQNSSVKNSGCGMDWYRGIVEVGYALGIGDYGMNNFRFNFINSISIGGSTFVGLGLGYRSYFEKSNPERYLVSRKGQVPVFLDLRTTFSSSSVTPYLALGIGTSQGYGGTEKKNEGLFFNASGGIWFNLSDRFAVFAGVAYELQQLEFANYSDNISYKEKVGSVSLNLGISF